MSLITIHQANNSHRKAAENQMKRQQNELAQSILEARPFNLLETDVTNHLIKRFEGFSRTPKVCFWWHRAKLDLLIQRLNGPKVVFWNSGNTILQIMNYKSRHIHTISISMRINSYNILITIICPNYSGLLRRHNRTEMRVSWGKGERLACCFAWSHTCVKQVE